MSIGIIEASDKTGTEADRALVQATTLLDFQDQSIRNLVEMRRWMQLPPKERLGAAYDFVDEIAFGYNASDDLRASQVLADGMASATPRAHLLMALFRAVGIPCRLHGFTIDKRRRKGRYRNRLRVGTAEHPPQLDRSMARRSLVPAGGFHPRSSLPERVAAPLLCVSGPFVGYGAATPVGRAPRRMAWLRYFHPEGGHQPGFGSSMPR